MSALVQIISPRFLLRKIISGLITYQKVFFLKKSHKIRWVFYIYELVHEPRHPKKTPLESQNPANASHSFHFPSNCLLQLSSALLNQCRFQICWTHMLFQDKANARPIFSVMFDRLMTFLWTQKKRLSFWDFLLRKMLAIFPSK